MRFLSNRTAIALTLVLVLQSGLFYTVASRAETTPPVSPLSVFPAGAGSWSLAKELPIEKEVQDVLRADDTLNRIYVNQASGANAYFFIAYFATQRTGSAPHSPKNCLPGSGWEPVLSPGTLPIEVEGRPAPIVVNQYVVARGEQKSVVLYWYQSHDRVIASEFSAKFWLIADSIRYRRSDTALVKVVVPVSGNQIDPAIQDAVDFVRSAYPAIARQLPT